MSEHDRTQATTVQRPAKDDKESWKAYWKAKGQEWRTEPEIDAERQRYLGECRSIIPDIYKGIYPFKDIKLSRADVEWLLATHENGRGPVDWEDPTQHRRNGLDLRGAELSDENLQGLPLARLQGGLSGDEWTQATMHQRHIAAIHLEKAILTYTRLEASVLTHAHLQGAFLRSTHLEGVDAFQVFLDGQMPANLRYAYFDTSTKLELAKIANEQHIGPRLLDIHWGGIDLTGVNWSTVWTLYDEHRARNPRTNDGMLKDRQENIRYYQEAARAYHQLALILRQQGITEDAGRFAYRAQRMQRKVYLYKRKLLSYLGSLFLDLLSGYGYKVGRCFIAYALVICIFASIYHLLGSNPAWNESIVISMTAFHGRGFFPEQFHPGDPQAFVAAIEAFVGLLIEVTFIATLTQRLFGR